MTTDASHKANAPHTLLRHAPIYRCVHRLLVRLRCNDDECAVVIGGSVVIIVVVVVVVVVVVGRSLMDGSSMVLLSPTADRLDACTLFMYSVLSVYTVQCTLLAFPVVNNAMPCRGIDDRRCCSLRCLMIAAAAAGGGDNDDDDDDDDEDDDDATK